MNRPSNPKIVKLLHAGTFDGFTSGDWLDFTFISLERSRLLAADKRELRALLSVAAGGGVA